MTKRHMDTEREYMENKKRKLHIQLADVPPVNSIKDLIAIGQSIKFYKNIDSVMLWRITPYLEELDNLVGMETLKESIFYQLLYYIQGMHTRNRTNEYLHTILIGPPGTGKTTVAQIIAKIYQGMGILSKNGPFKIAHRDDFVAGYLGQTAIKTQKLLKSCLGGVLFIDEVYALAPRDGDRDSFAKEAIDTLTSFLSEHSQDFCCIAAGYEKDINEYLFAMNQGLRRRFPWVHKIDDYKPSDLASIFEQMVSKADWKLSANHETVTDIISKNKEYFAYAGGDIENYFIKCKMVHSRRVLSLDISQKFTLIEDDLKNALTMMKNNKCVIRDEPPFGMYI